MDNINMEAIVTKIDKLLNMTTKNGCSDAEAMAALTKAQALMAEYNIEVADIESAAKARNEDEIVTTSCEHKDNLGYRKPLGAIIADNYRCKCYIQGNTVVFMGLPQDTKIARKAFEFAYKFIKRRGNQEYYEAVNNGYDGRGIINSYATGFLRGLKQVLGEQSVALMIVTPPSVKEAYANLTLSKGTGGMRTGDGVYSSYVRKGERDAHEQFGRRKLAAV